MDLYVPLLPASIPIHLVFLILTTFCAFLFPCSLCLESSYQYCNTPGSTCGDRSFKYPVGVGYHGCGHPSFQIDCVENSTVTIAIHNLSYTILDLYQNNDSFVIVRNENCDFLNDPLTDSDLEDTTFRITSISDNWNLYVYKCSTPLLDLLHYNIEQGKLKKCNTTVYYALDNMVNPIPGCDLEPLTDYAGMMKWVSSDIERDKSCASCEASGGICGYDIYVSSEPAPFLCHCMDGSSTKQCPAHGMKTINGVAIGLSVGAAVLIAAGLLVGMTLYAKRRKPAPRSTISKVEEFLKKYSDEMPTRYSLSHLKNITNNFAEELGEGGFGVVYKGKLTNGTLVAVKLLDRHRHSESTEFMNEVATIGRVHHINLVRLLGYCFESFTSALVYEFMLHGSLEKFIFAGKERARVLNWEQLYSIALGAARGIAYLHQDCDRRIIHFDIKPHNILLDADFTPKVSDFGLAKLCGKGDDHISMTAARGTPGYVAPELCDRALGPVTDKSDVYSFGMLLLEIVGERKNFDWKVSRSSQFYFPEWAFKLLESGEFGMRLRGDGEMEAEEEENARRLTKVGLWCIQYNYRDRPGMSRVVQMLERDGGDVANPPLPSNSAPAAPEIPLLSSAEESSSIEIRF